MPVLDYIEVLGRVTTVRAEPADPVKTLTLYQEFVKSLAEGRFYGDVTLAAKELDKLANTPQQGVTIAL